MNPANNATTWLMAVWESDLTPTQKLICCYLRTFMNDHKDVAWPSKPRIAHYCGIKSVRTVQNHMKVICQAGYLSENGFSDVGTIRYEVMTPALDAPPAKFAPPRKKRQGPPANIAPELNNRTKQDNTYIGKSRFSPPTVEQVRQYCQERGNNIDPQYFVDWNTSKGWKVGNQPMKDWKASVRTWEKRERQNGNNQPVGSSNPRGPATFSASQLIDEGNVIDG